MNGDDLSRQPLQFGIFDWLETEPRSPSLVLEERLKLLEYADQAGFFCYHLSEHHFTPLSLSSSPGIFLAAAAQRTRNLRLGPLVYLLPFYDPVRLAQEICLLDHLSLGRLEVGVGRGISPIEAAQYNVDFQKGRSIFQEALEIVLDALTKGRVEHDGEHFSYHNIEMHFGPRQQPYPPLWYATTNPDAIPWAAQNSINTAHIFHPASTTKAQFDLYKSHWEERSPEDGRLNAHVPVPKLGLVRHLYVAPTDEQAERECRPAFESWYGKINHYWVQYGSRNLAYMSDYDDLIQKEVVIRGSPSSVKEQVHRAIDESGANYFCPVFAFGDLTYDQVLTSMTLFAEQVMPSFS